MFFELKREAGARYPTPVSLMPGLSIRHLLLLIVSTLTLVSVCAITWNAFQLVNKNQTVQQSITSNKITEIALELNIALARERGFTASLLSNTSLYSPDVELDLNNLRSKSDHVVRRLSTSLNRFAFAKKGAAVKHLFEASHKRILESRRKVDAALSGNAQRISPAMWMDSMTRSVEDIRKVSSLLGYDYEGSSQASKLGMMVKDVFFDLSESLGKDRALIGMTIAQKRPFTEKELQLLSNYQFGSKKAFEKLESLMMSLPRSSDVMLARLQLGHNYKRGYLSLRNAVIKSGIEGQTYPVTSLEWFQKATQGINAVINLSTAIDAHLESDIAQSRQEHSNIIGAFFLTLTVVIVVYIWTFNVVFNRIIHPLREIESSAKTISNGDFTKELVIAGKDEFSKTANAFEIMRQFLIDDRRERAEKAEEEKRKLNIAIEQSVSSIIMTDVKGVIEYVNPQFYRTTGYTEDEVIGCRSSILKSGKTSAATYRDLWQTITSGGVWHGELLNKKKNGEFYWELLSISPVRNSAGKITHFISIQHDISKRKALEESLNFMAHHDGLTGLPNRTLLIDRFGQMTAHAQRTDSKVALLMLDLDHFKAVNDSLGHTVGDQLLAELANRLKTATRDCDTVARYGGDEFVFLVEDVGSIESLITLVERLMETLDQPLQVEQHELHVSGSMGVSIWPDDGNSIDELMTKADTAMYHAKDEGRARFQFFTDEINEKISQRLILESNLRKAIDREEFELYYQPQVSLDTGKVTGVEALIRWNHPEEGMVPPFKFIPLAEETSLIKPIGSWVLKKACAQAAVWKAAGYDELTVAVNVSVRELDDLNFLPSLEAVLNETGLSPELLELEITESSVMSNPDKMLEVLQGIKSLGIKLALDDFGTGYSSLSYLRQYPFDKLKIDRSFIIEVVNKPEDVVIIEAITQMAHSLDMDVLVEGVETNVQIDYISRCGCDEIQGYLISKPVSTKDFEEQFNSGHFQMPKGLSGAQADLPL